ncbi:MAG: hypothetical protein C0631_16775 [Sedimenticola sp.]|nr:MAG: hypothetical protein C0631_16775 [Sedimenticola sp.]
MTTSRIAGWLLLGMVLLSVLHGLNPYTPRLFAGIAAWGAGLLLVSRLKGLQRTQTLIMFLIGLTGLLYGLFTAQQAQIEKAIATNQALLAMLTAVSFLRLVTLPAADKAEKTPIGTGALWRTLLGVHLFGAVINLSAVMILGDRQSAKQPLTPLQATVLSRGFALASHWSPFFAAMGIALTNAPGSRLITLSSVGLPVTLLALLVTGWTLTRKPEAKQFIGYPMHFDALWIPGLLASAVLLLHQLQQDIPILTLIALLSLGLTLSLLLIRYRTAGIGKFIGHIETNLPGMSGELCLFLAAGVLAAGISTVIATSGIDITLAQFGALEATYLLFAMVAISVVGVHPVISIATAGGIFAPLVSDPNLLGITFLMTWALGVSTSPFSGMHLGMQGRFNIDSRNFIRWNGGFTLFMLVVDTLVLHLYAALG